MKEFIKKNKLVILFVVLFICYFEYSITVLWDSAHYMSYVNIFEGILPWNSWDVVRGPVFPIIIYLGNFIFGKTTQGLILNTFVYYVLMLFFVYKILIYFFDEMKLDERKKKKLIVFILIFIIINPIIFGFYHSLLTEFVAITFSIVSCYLSTIWGEIDYKQKKIKYILFSVTLTFLVIFCWFLKQPYVSGALFPFCVSYFIQIFEKWDFRNFMVRSITIIFCCLCLLFSIKVWNSFLTSKGNDPNTDRNPTNSLGSQLINSIDFLEVVSDEKIYTINYISSLSLSSNEKNEISKMLEEDKKYIIINEYKGHNVVNSDYIIMDDGNLGMFKSLKYIFKIFIDRPIDLISSYVSNYLSIIDVFSTETTDGVGYKSNKKIDINFSNEISTIAYRPYSYIDNVFYMLPEMRERVECYNQPNHAFKGFNYLFKILQYPFLYLFKLLFLLLPFTLIYSIFKRINIKNSKKSSKVYNLVIILLGYSFLHLLLHTVTGAIIDRYAVPGYITVILGTLMLIYYEFKFKKSK